MAIFRAFCRTDQGGEFAPWQLCTRFDIPDRQDPTRPYLTRWRLLQTPWFGLYLHRIHGPDRDDHMHDHPWPLVSVVLRGGYTEARPRLRKPGTIRLRKPGTIRDAIPVFRHRGWLSLAFRRATDLHRIEYVRANTWTLLFVGRRCRRWGFFTPRGWVDYRTYLGLDRAP